VRKITRLLTVGALGASIAFTAVGCAYDTVTERVYEDCETDDQDAREDDCGYWRSPAGILKSGNRPAFDWQWYWFDWVTVGRDSSPPRGWVPPVGTNPPYHDKQVKRKKPKTNKNTTRKPATSTTRKVTSGGGSNTGRTEKSYTGTNKSTTTTNKRTGR
jgi:hypothetical protein